jgi:hypothetical protein
LQKQASGLQLQLADAKHEIQELQHKLAAGASNARMQEDYALEAPNSILVRHVVHLPEAGPEPWWNILLRPKANVVIASVYWLGLLVVLLCTHRTIAVDNLSTLSGVFCCIVASMLPASVIEFVFKLLHETVRGRHDSHVLHSITDAGERDRMSHTGWLGTLMFAFGIWDTVRQVQFAVHVGGTLLFYCVVSSVVCTLATTWILAFGILDEIILAENSSGQNVQRALTKGRSCALFRIDCQAINYRDSSLHDCRMVCGDRLCPIHLLRLRFTN